MCRAAVAWECRAGGRGVAGRDRDSRRGLDFRAARGRGGREGGGRRKREGRRRRRRPSQYNSTAFPRGLTHAGGTNPGAQGRRCRGGTPLSGVSLRPSGRTPPGSRKNCQTSSDHLLSLVTRKFSGSGGASKAAGRDCWLAGGRGVARAGAERGDVASTRRCAGITARGIGVEPATALEVPRPGGAEPAEAEGRHGPAVSSPPARPSPGRGWMRKAIYFIGFLIQEVPRPGGAEPAEDRGPPRPWRCHGPEAPSPPRTQARHGPEVPRPGGAEPAEDPAATAWGPPRPRGARGGNGAAGAT